MGMFNRHRYHQNIIRTKPVTLWATRMNANQISVLYFKQSSGSHVGRLRDSYFNQNHLGVFYFLAGDSVTFSNALLDHGISRFRPVPTEQADT